MLRGIVTSRNRNSRILAVSVALGTAILLGDLFIPLDVAGGVLYVVAVLATMWHTSRHAATIVAAISTGFLFLGGFLGAPLDFAVVDLINRVLGLLAIWLTALLVQERKVDEDALMTREHQVRSILNGTADAIVSLDETGRVRSSNPAAGKIFGYEASELAGRDITSLIVSSYSSEVSEYVGDALAKRTNTSTPLGCKFSPTVLA